MRGLQYICTLIGPSSPSMMQMKTKNRRKSTEGLLMRILKIFYHEVILSSMSMFTQLKLEMEILQWNSTITGYSQTTALRNMRHIPTSLMRRFLQLKFRSREPTHPIHELRSYEVSLRNVKGLRSLHGFRALCLASNKRKQVCN